MDFPHTQVDVNPTIMYAIVEHECSPLSYIMIGRSSTCVFARMQSEHIQARLYKCERAREPDDLFERDYPVWEIHKAPFLI
jgi:hypothetical protein